MNTAITNANLALRFVLDPGALAATATWGSTHPTARSRAPRSASASGWAPPRCGACSASRTTRGMRPCASPAPCGLLIEIGVWGGATAPLAADGQPGPAAAFATLAVISNALTPGRLDRLIRNC